MKETLEKLLLESDSVNKVYKYEYKGKGVSTNDYYNSGHWKTRNKIKKQYGEILYHLIAENPPEEEIDKFGLVIFYNSRHDTDNVVGFGKIFVDVLKDKFSIIEEDNKYHYKLCSCVPDLDLEMNTFQFVLIDYGSN